MEKFGQIEPGSKEERLIRCCRNGTLEEVRALLDAGAEVNSSMPCFIPECGLTMDAAPIHLAAENSDVRVIQLLVERGADVNVTDVYGNTPLYYAAENNTLTMIKYLVSLGNDSLLENDDGDNLLTVSACNPHKDVLEYFLQQGVDIDGCSDINPLGVAMRYGTVADMEFFIDHGANLEDAFENALLCAPIQNIRYLFHKGCDLNAAYRIFTEDAATLTPEKQEEMQLLFAESGQHKNGVSHEAKNR